MTGRRILMVTSGLDAGGSELQLVQLAAGLRTRGWDVEVLCMQEGGTYAAALTATGVPVRWTVTRRLPGPVQLLRLARAIRRSRAAVVHTQAFRANLWGRAAAQALGMPVVASVRATYRYLPRTYHSVERQLARRTARIVTPSRATTDHLVRSIGVRPSTVTTIPNGVDTRLFHPDRDATAFRRAQGIDDGGPVILHAGRLVAQKNPHGLLDAVGQMAANHPGAVLVMAGTGPMEATLRAHAATLPARVIFTGELGRVAMADAMASADVCCLMSDFEGMPNVLLEAMASGRPVVSTAVDGAAELLGDGACGVLVPPRRPDMMAGALDMLARSPAERARLGAAGRRTVLERYSIERNVELHAAIYTSIVEARGQCAPVADGV